MAASPGRESTTVPTGDLAPRRNQLTRGGCRRDAERVEPRLATSGSHEVHDTRNGSTHEGDQTHGVLAGPELQPLDPGEMAATGVFELGVARLRAAATGVESQTPS
jgi:hypothetical protein